MLYFPIILLMLIGLVLITRPLTVLFHELGHAIPAVLLTRQKVTIYIGSYGDPGKSLKLSFGFLIIFFRYNPFAWRLGLCVPSAKAISINKQIVYILCGPLTSLIIGITACYFTFAYDLHGLLKLLLVMFLGSSTVDLLVNLIPNPKPIALYDGKITHNDGYLLKQLFYYKRFSREYSAAVNLYNERKYTDAAVLCEKMISAGIKIEDIYRLGINAHVYSKNYERVKELSAVFLKQWNMNSDELCNLAHSYSRLDLHAEALELYDKSLELNPENKYSLNNKGFTLNLMNRFEEAIVLFDMAISVDRDFAYSYNNRGLSKIKIGKSEEGLEDINHSFKLDPDNSYYYVNVGIYHFDKKEFNEALKLFKKAKELDDTTYGINELIEDVEKKLH